MMAIPFIGRESHLKDIEGWIKEDGTQRISFYQGAAGIGKSRLLREVEKLYRDVDNVTLEFIDFDEKHLLLPANLCAKIMHVVGRDDYYETEEFLNLQQINIGYKIEAVNAKDQLREFIITFNDWAATHRVVLLLDSTDKLLQSPVWKIITDIIQFLDNFLIVVAGRTAEALCDSVKSEGSDLLVNYEEIPPFSNEESEEYLEKKERNLITVLDSAKSKIMAFAGGNPLYLELAAESFARGDDNILLNKFESGSLDYQVPSEFIEKKEVFKSTLVTHFAQRRPLIRRLLSAMALIYPVNTELIKILMSSSIDEARGLLEQAKELSYVKSDYAGNWLSLHDEVRRLIATYVWPTIGDSYQFMYYQRAADYYTKQIHNLASQENQKYWFFQQEKLRYILLLDHLQGVKEFIRLFDQATQIYRLDVREALTCLVNDALLDSKINRLEDKDLLYEYRIRLARHKTSMHEFEEAQNQLDLLLIGCHSALIELRVKILISQANNYMQIGELKSAKAQLVQILADHSNRLSIRLKGDVFNMLGQVRRRMGRLEEASKSYKSAIESYNQVEDTEPLELAATLNNLAYVLSLLGDNQKAFNYADQALETRKKARSSKDIGLSYSVLGELYRHNKQYDKALNSFNQALNILKSDRVWTAKLFNSIGSIYWLMQEFAKAEEKLAASLRLQVKTESGWTNYVLGRIEKERKNLEKSKEYLKNSYDLFRDSYDMYGQITAQLALAEILYKAWMNSHNREEKEIIEDQLRELMRKAGSIIREECSFAYHYGIMKRFLGDITFQSQKYGEAWLQYGQAYYFLGLYPQDYDLEGFERFSFLKEAQLLKVRIKTLITINSEEAIRGCELLDRYWRNIENYPVIKFNRDFKQLDFLLSICDTCKGAAKQENEDENF